MMKNNTLNLLAFLMAVNSICVNAQERSAITDDGLISISFQKGAKTLSCGQIAAYLIITTTKKALNTQEVEEYVQGNKANSFLSLHHVLQGKNIESEAFHVESIKELEVLKPPFIAQMRLDKEIDRETGRLHFTVVYKISNNEVLLIDPLFSNSEPYRMTQSDFSDFFTGNVLVMK